MPKKATAAAAPADKNKTLEERLDRIIANGDAYAAELARIIKETLTK